MPGGSDIAHIDTYIGQIDRVIAYIDAYIGHIESDITHINDYIRKSGLNT